MVSGTARIICCRFPRDFPMRFYYGGFSVYRKNNICGKHSLTALYRFALECKLETISKT